MKTGQQRASLLGLALALAAAGCGGGAMDGAGDGVGGSSTVGGTGGAQSGGGGGNGAGGAGTLPDGGAAGMTGDAGNPNMPPVTPVAGVVQGGACVPLCLISGVTEKDYGFENGVSCVVKNTYTASISTPCVVGMPVPPKGPPAGSPGVIINMTSGNQCVALCGPEVQDNADANPNDGYGYELDSSCIIPGGKVAMASLPCTTGAPIGDGGATVTGPGRLLGDSCTRICTVTTTDSTGTGYGFEFGASCLIPGTAAAMKGLACQVGVPEPTGPPITLNPNPPPGQVKKPAGMLTSGFFVTGGRLYDKFGNDFVPRGINNPDFWFDVGDQYLAYNALDNIAADGANVVRIVWQTAAPGTPSLLRRIIRHAVELKLVPLIELHDVTGGTSNQDLLNMAAYYTSAPVKQILLDFEAFLLINIANEWSGSDFMGGYSAAVTAMRAAGINHTLIIDANGFGQNAASITSNGAALLAADPQHNLMFSVHMYDQYTNNAGGHSKITSTLQSAVTAQLPLVVGEFGWEAGNPLVPIDAAFIMSECARLKLGFLGWSWKGNSAAQAYLDLAIDWEGMQLSSWGNTLIKGANGLSTSTTKATIYTE